MAERLAHHGERISTFTAVPRSGHDCVHVPGWESDETPYVEAMCEKYDNIDAHYARPGDETLLAGLDEFFVAAGNPPRNSFNRWWIEKTMNASADLGARVILTGSAGNETISYHGHHYLTDLPLHVADLGVCA